MKTKPTLGLVLSGGGARGAFQVGVYERLLEDPRFAGGPVVLSGTSAGAINAALIAAGRAPRELLAFWLRLGDDPPAVASAPFQRSLWHGAVALALREPFRLARSWRRVAHHAIDHLPPRRGSLSAWALQVLLLARFDLVSKLLARVGDDAVFETRRLKKRLVAELGGEVVPVKPGVRLAINAIDAPTGHVVRFVSPGEGRGRLGPEYEIVPAITVEMVVASASIPILFPPVAIGHHLLWDGGVLVNTPLAPMTDLGADEIVTVLVTEPPDPSVRGHFKNLGDAIERVADTFLENTYNVDRKLLLERNGLAEQHPAHGFRAVTLFEPIRPQLGAVFTAGSYLDFCRTSILRMYAEGRRATDAWLAAGPVVDSLRRHRAAARRPAA